MNKTTKILMAAFGIAALVSCAPRSEKAAGVSEKDETTLDVTGAKTPVPLPIQKVKLAGKELKLAENTGAPLV